MISLKILFVLCLTLQYAASFEILAIVSLPLRSHYMAFDPLFKELAKRGHSVTVVNNFPDKMRNENLTYIQLPVFKSDMDKFREINEYEQSDYLHWNNYIRSVKTIPKVVEDDCELLLSKAEELHKLFDENTFDVIFVEQFVSDCALYLAALKTEAPIIGITSHVLLPWSFSRLGIPFDLSTDLFYFSGAGYRPNLLQKFETFVMHSTWNSVFAWFVNSKICQVFDKYLPGNNLDVHQMAKDRMKMMFVYQHFSYTGARLMAPQLVEIGGIHVGTPKRLPEDIDTFLNKSSHGAIYVSFGSNLVPSTMSSRLFQSFLGAFKNIEPIRVVWKFDNDTLLYENDNVFIGKWFPQLDILCHPNVLGFVSHGGMLSTTEAASCGVPMVAIPFFGDQFTNAASIEETGLGIHLSLNCITADILSADIMEIFGKEFQERANEISKLFHDRPIRAMDNAIYWTEYVARYRTSPPQIEAKYVPWYHVGLLDVYGCVILASCSILFIINKFIFRPLRLKKIKNKTE